MITCTCQKQVKELIRLKSIPKYTQLKPVQRNPATERRSTMIGKNQNC